MNVAGHSEIWDRGGSESESELSIEEVAVLGLCGRLGRLPDERPGPELAEPDLPVRVRVHVEVEHDVQLVADIPSRPAGRIAANRGAGTVVQGVARGSQVEVVE